MATNVYTAHRENQREWILEISEELFAKGGIEQVTIRAIADACRLTRATIYKYFSNKEEIAQEIFKIITKGWKDRNEQMVWNFQGNGYQRLERFLVSFFDYLFQNPQEASFVAELNYLYAKYWPTEMFVETMMDNLQEDRQFVLECVETGIDDGSLRADMDPELMVAAYFNFLSGMLNRFGTMGDKVEAEFGIRTRTIFEQICRVFLDGLKPLRNVNK